MLRLLGHIYGKIASLRNLLYDKGIIESNALGARTISVGNITAGGTGKTPLVAYVAEILAARGETVCILTRGYGRENANERVLVSDGNTVFADASSGGDEPVELAHRLLGKAIVIADADRVAAAEWATRKFGITGFVLDDAFQHRKAKRDVDIVCIDATDPFGGGKMLPSGRLREPLENLSRADVVVITRSELADDIAGSKAMIRQIAPHASIFESRASIRRLDLLSAKPAFAFCGIGNPASFFAMLRNANVELVGMQEFRDHHRYSRQDIDSIGKGAADAGAQVLLTTAKDAVKLDKESFTLPLVIVGIDVEIDDAQIFAELL